MQDTAIANYEAERALFEELIRSNAEPNILLFQGESGSGKSHLLDYCVRSASAIPSVLIKLQGGGDTVPTLFTRLGSEKGWPRLPNFSRTVATLLEQTDKVEDPIWQMGMHRHLREISQISDPNSRLARYQLLADAWFADALNFERPFLIALDSYENSSTLFDQWFRHEFLVGAANSHRTKVLVGGQKVPARDEAWSFCASIRELKGIQEAEAWMKWAGAAGYQVPSLEYLSGVVGALQGNPSQIIQFIQTQFPRSSGPIAPKASIREQRRRVRENMVEAFSLSELKDICFDLEIDYESLPGHDHLTGFVRELLAYAGRVGRLNELVQVCRDERPHLAW